MRGEERRGKDRREMERRGEERGISKHDVCSFFLS